MTSSKTEEFIFEIFLDFFLVRYITLDALLRYVHDKSLSKSCKKIFCATKILGQGYRVVNNIEKKSQ